MEFANYDDYEDYQNPFDGMDYDGVMEWLDAHMDELESNGIDPEHFLRAIKEEFSMPNGAGGAGASATPAPLSTEEILHKLPIFLGQCSGQVLSQAFDNFIFPAVLAVMLQIFAHGGMDIPIRHTMSFISGFMLLVKFHTVALGVFALSFVMFWINIASAISKKYLVILLPASALVAELFTGESWGGLRGPMLVFLLKFLSVVLTEDLTVDLNDMSQVMSLMGYYFHPATMLLGPWIPFSLYKKSIETPSFRITSLILIIPGALFLIFSTCVSSLFEKSTGWIGEVNDTISFHCSNYYILYFTQVLVLLAGAQTANNFCSPMKVFFPFELYEVCRAWNYPVHEFLRKHVFLPLKASSSTFRAIMMTFFISAILHGLNFPIFATLMILGLGSFSEFEFRRKVGTNFNLPRILPSSIQAKRAAKLAKDPPIKKPGDSDTSEASDESFLRAFIQAFINFSFLLLNYYHLFFVGSVLEAMISR
ncbi:Oidioi.mRNA.OKI2018_I69.PAR.g10435.t1.cds [Oikopleura dioica]|uniref:Protein-serine O-palmitoleoyltransferase porcupine n=1 Tax=Oikopleura dioica TaxID=34765 RepID=A0ABN7RTP9_OIKDI|nr:Oidioi.mRNA.OKI2018_I69.PAR.g10435.t1.cds [Oikopleura dioica]